MTNDPVDLSRRPLEKVERGRGQRDKYKKGMLVRLVVPGASFAHHRTILALSQTVHFFMMQLQRVLSGAVMVAAVAALPADLISQGPSNVLAPVQSFHDTPPVVANTEPFVSLATEKRGVSAPIGNVERTVAKRATLTVDIWMDINGGGRHEGLITDSLSP